MLIAFYDGGFSMDDFIFNNQDKCGAKDFLKIISTFHCVARFSLEGTLLEANDKFFDTFGYDKSDVIGKHHRLFLKDPNTTDPMYEKMWPGFADGKARAGEVLRKNKAGQVIWLQAVYCPMTDDAGQVFCVLKLAVPKNPALTDDGINAPISELLA